MNLNETPPKAIALGVGSRPGGIRPGAQQERRGEVRLAARVPMACHRVKQALQCGWKAPVKHRTHLTRREVSAILDFASLTESIGCQCELGLSKALINTGAQCAPRPGLRGPALMESFQFRILAPTHRR